MKTLLSVCLGFAALFPKGLNAGAPFELIGVGYFDAPVVQINPQTGVGVEIGTAGFSALNSLAASGAGTLYSASGNRLVSINPLTGLGTAAATLNFGTNAAQVRGMAFSPSGALYAINNGGDDASSPSATDNLYTIDPVTGLATLIGNTGVPGLQGLEFAPSGELYGWEVGAGTGLGLVTINPLTGAVTDVNPSVGGRSADIQALAFGPDGVLYGAKSALYTVDPVSGAITLVGSGGYSDVRGLAVVPEPQSLLLVSLGALVMGAIRWRRQIGRRGRSDAAAMRRS